VTDLLASADVPSAVVACTTAARTPILTGALNSGELDDATPTPADLNVSANIPGGGVSRTDEQQRANGPANLSLANGGSNGDGQRDQRRTRIRRDSSQRRRQRWPDRHSRATTHVVQKDETLALISKAVYGARLHPHILRANPPDPKKSSPA
jgi:hypothetical protein